MNKEHWKCRLFGHRWNVVYVGKYNEWKFIGVHCLRWQCWKGYNELSNFLNKVPHDFGTHSEKYFDKPNLDPSPKA